jgi:hypothetical protein
VGGQVTDGDPVVEVLDGGDQGRHGRRTKNEERRTKREERKGKNEKGREEERRTKREERTGGFF